jgi:pimeloyl-ACP methyl ester carboxylesterase
MLRHAIKDKARYTPAVHRQYVEALPDATARHATWVYAREVIGSSDWYDALWGRRERLTGRPALLVWGTDDPAFGGVLPRWQALFPGAEVIEFAGVGHAPPEERGPESATAIARFLGG